MPADKPSRKPEHIRLSTECRRHIAVHMGAMGDFLLIWPALLSLARAEADKELLWAGKTLHAPWAAAAGWQFASADIRQAVERLYSCTSWPDALADSLVTWFGLLHNPLECRESRLWFVAGAQEGRFISPRALVRRALQARGVPWAADWIEVWRGAFGGYDPKKAHAWDLLLFPGAGHRAKHWGLVQFLELALRCEAEGWRTCFVLGPAELERGLEPLAPGFLAAVGEAPRLPKVCTPGSLQELSNLLLQTRRVVGNDCGPMHLASMHGVPGVVLFGPTSRRQWAPQGLTALAVEMTCRPCTVTTAGISCERSLCLEALGVEEVLKQLAALTT